MSPEDRRAFPALAAPASLLIAGVGMGLVALLPRSLSVIGAGVLLAGPVVLGVWAHGGFGRPAVGRAVVASVVVAVAVVAAIALGLLPAFEHGRGLSPAGVWVLVRAPVLVLVAATLALRPGHGTHDLRIAASWAAAIAVTVFGDRAVTGIALLAGADAVSGGLAFLAVPSVALAMWFGGVAAFGLGARRGSTRRATHRRGREELLG